MSDLRARLFKLYEEIYEESKYLFVGCDEVGCNHLCEDVEYIPGLTASDAYAPMGVTEDGHTYFNGSYILLPWEHEFVAQRIGEDKTRYVVEMYGEMPVARFDDLPDDPAKPVDPSGYGKDDRCAYYEPFSGTCSIVFDRPVVCRTYPLFPVYNADTKSVDVFSEMMCPLSVQMKDKVQKFWVRAFAKLSEVIPEEYWRQLYTTQQAPNRILTQSYALPLGSEFDEQVTKPVTHPLQFPNWKEEVRVGLKILGQKELAHHRCSVPDVRGEHV